MTRRIGGKVRDQRIRDRRAVPALAERALSADVATTATNATNASNTTTVLPVTPKVQLDANHDRIALVTGDGEIQPVTLANLLVFLESRYVLTPIP